MTVQLDRVRQATLELPETEERLSHGQPTFFVAGKQFAQFRNNHHDDGKTVVCVRTSGLDEQAMLLETDPETYSRPAYLHPS
ncbi:MAG TPA: MmcQ/YjbR family DNA-binding protein, partial [Sphingomicrobium sp.]